MSSGYERYINKVIIINIIIKVSATLKIAIFPYSRSQRFQIDMLERKYYFCRKISGVKDFLSLIILIDR